MCWTEDWQSGYWGDWRWRQFSSSVFLTFLSRFSLYHTLLFLCRFLSPALHPSSSSPPCREGRYQVLPNNNLQIHQVTKADEGVYRCEASVEARGEIDFVDIAVVVNGESRFGDLQPDNAWKGTLHVYPRRSVLFWVKLKLYFINMKFPRPPETLDNPKNCSEKADLEKVDVFLQKTWDFLFHKDFDGYRIDVARAEPRSNVQKHTVPS